MENAVNHESAGSRAEPSERCKRACRYNYYKRLSNTAREAIERHEKDGEPLPVYLENYSMERLNDRIVKALGIFEACGEVTYKDMLPFIHPTLVFCTIQPSSFF